VAALVAWSMGRISSQNGWSPLHDVQKWSVYSGSILTLCTPSRNLILPLEFKVTKLWRPLPFEIWQTAPPRHPVVPLWKSKLIPQLSPRVRSVRPCSSSGIRRTSPPTTPELRRLIESVVVASAGTGVVLTSCRASSSFVNIGAGRAAPSCPVGRRKTSWRPA